MRSPLLLSLLLTTTSLADTTLHVSPTGDDSRSGLTPAEALATPQGARDRIRAMKREHTGALAAPVTVLFAPGTYRLADTFTLTPEDSGTDAAPITYTAGGAADEKTGQVILTGGTPLPAWRETRLDGKPVWATDVPAELLGGQGDNAVSFRELYISGQRRPRARHPNTGYLKVEAPVGAAPDAKWHDGTNAFRFTEADAAIWKKLGSRTDESPTEVVTFTRWVDTHLTLAAIDHDTRTATFTRRNMFLLQPDDLYLIENSRELLDSPGEWWLDRTGETDSRDTPGGGESPRPAIPILYYIPLPGEDPSHSPAIAPRLTTLMHLAGDAQAERFVEQLIFRGLTFSHSQWWFPKDFKAAWPSPEVVGFPQAAVGVPGAIRAEGTRGVTFENCTVSHVGGYGLELGRGCTDNLLSYCTITDLGAGGLKIGEPGIPEHPANVTGRNRIEDCTITDGGHIHHQAVGLWIGQSASNIISHNLIAEFDYTGISIGWTWGYGKSGATANIIEHNEVARLGARAINTDPPTSPLGDMAGIYTLGKQPGTLIHHNYFHDIAGRSIAWGIYFDEGSSDITAEYNIVHRTTHGGFHQHYGRDNIVRNNVFALGRDAQLWRTRREDQNSFTLTRNVVVYDSGVLLMGDWSDNFINRKNLYWRTDGKPVTFPGEGGGSGGADLAAWQARPLKTHAPDPAHPIGRDTGSVIADPGLTFPLLHVPSPPVGSALMQIGFETMDLRTVGPRPR